MPARFDRNAVQFSAIIGEAQIADRGRKSWTTLAIGPRFTHHVQGCRRSPTTGVEGAIIRAA
jgi:hypothetical protein